MAWKTILEKEQVEIRVDDLSKNIILEVSSGGVMKNYITLHLSETEANELIEALNAAKKVISA